MKAIPRDKNLDSTLALLREGYEFISKRCERYHSDIFETRLMFQKAICMRGEEAAKMFYEGERFTRQGALPKTTLMLLQGKGSVQTLDGEPHHHRKQMFMSLMSPEAIERLTDAMAAEWEAYIDKWRGMDEVVLFDEVREILCRAVCRWAGVPLPGLEVKKRTEEFTAMVDGAGSLGPRMWKGMLLRTRTERWIQDIVVKVRAGEIDAPEGSAAHVIARHRELNGELLDTKVAAVELINILRPTIAVSRFIGFAALALHEHPEPRQQLQAGPEDYTELFVQEVRRFYPFFPAVGGRARMEFDWNGIRFAKRQWVLLDLYGTNHDPNAWDNPEAFRPERFRQWDRSAFNFIPQGGGDHYQSHRCAGEWITIALVKRAVRLLATAMDYEVPRQDLRIDLNCMPAIPRSRLVISHVRPVR